VAGQKTDGWLPEAADFERLMQKSGVERGRPIVVTYKGEKAIESAMAARLLFTLKYFGHDPVAILDGGTAACVQTGRKVKFGRSKSRRSDFTAGPGRAELLAALADVKAISEGGGGQLLDVREPAGYLGVAHKLAAVDPQWYGHIPGAGNLPMTVLSNDVGPAAQLFDSDTLRQTLTLLDADPEAPTVVYCNSGIMASLGWFVMSQLLGNRDVRLYDGSMQEWSLEKMPVVSLKRD
jgi:thiosulfate/3-mercaptopyruvate sulfurtransferase